MRGKILKFDLSSCERQEVEEDDKGDKVQIILVTLADVLPWTAKFHGQQFRRLLKRILCKLTVRKIFKRLK